MVQEVDPDQDLIVQLVAIVDVGLGSLERDLARLLDENTVLVIAGGTRTRLTTCNRSISMRKLQRRTRMLKR